MSPDHETAKAWKEHYEVLRNTVFADLSAFSTFGQFASTVREVMGLSQAEVAERFPCSKQNISALESDEHPPTTERFWRWANAVQLPFELSEKALRFLTKLQQPEPPPRLFQPPPRWPSTHVMEPQLYLNKPQRAEFCQRLSRYLAQLPIADPVQTLADKALMDVQAISTLLSGDKVPYQKTVLQLLLALNSISPIRFASVQHFMEATRPGAQLQQGV